MFTRASATQNIQKWMNLPGMMLSKISQTAFAERSIIVNMNQWWEKGDHWLPLGVVFTGEAQGGLP